MRKNKNESGGISCIGCGFIIFILLFNVFVGAWSVDRILLWLGKDIPFIADALIGLFTAEISVPVAIVGEILRACGVF
jgi:hypothetical protein